MTELILFDFVFFIKILTYIRNCVASSNTLAFIIDKSHQNFQNTSETLQKCSYDGPLVLL